MAWARPLRVAVIYAVLVVGVFSCLASMEPYAAVPRHTTVQNRAPSDFAEIGTFQPPRRFLRPGGVGIPSPRGRIPPSYVAPGRPLPPI